MVEVRWNRVASPSEVHVMGEPENFISVLQYNTTFAVVLEKKNTSFFVPKKIIK